MNREYIAKSKLSFETYPERWRSFGADLVDAGSPSPCNRSPIARKVLCGRWQEAYQDWLKAGEFSSESEEIMLAFILATEVVFHRRPPAPIPTDLPKRIWNDAEAKKALHRVEDVAYWHQCVASLCKEFGRNTPGGRLERQLGELLQNNKPAEAEAFFKEHDLAQYALAEQTFALIKTCQRAHGAKADEARAKNTVWFYADAAGRRSEPISEADLKNAFERGDLPRTTKVWTEGMKAWEQAAFIKAFRPNYKGALPPALS